MNTTTYRIMAASIALLVLAAGIFFFSRRAGEGPSVSSGVSTTSNATSSYKIGGTIIPGGNATITEVGVHAPDYRKSLTFSASVTPDVRSALQSQFTALKNTLAKNSTDFNAWLELGIIRKIGGDYNGAAEDWIYVSELYPRSKIAFNNLGDLYANFIKDYPKAEAAYRTVLSLDPHDVNALRRSRNLKLKRRSRLSPFDNRRDGYTASAAVYFIRFGVFTLL